MHIVALLLLLLTACSGSDGGTPTGPGGDASPQNPVGVQPVATVTVTAPSSSMAAGSLQQLSATLKDASGNTLSGRTVTWSSNNQAVLTVSNAGLVSGVSSGTAMVTAMSEERSASVTLTVSGGGLFTSLGIILTPPTFGVPSGQPVADATAIQLSDGRVRLYLFAQGQGTRSAISTTAEGTSFVAEPGVRSNNEAWGQPRVIRLSDGRIRLYYVSGDGIRSAISADGLTFTDEPGFRISNSSIGYEVGAPTIVALRSGGYRMYFSDLERPGAPPGGHYIRSAISTDLLSWTVEPGIVLGVGAASGITGTATHPFAVAEADGSVTLYYQGERQEGVGPNGTYRGIYRATSADGRTFTTEQKTGIAFGGDPDVLTLADGTVLMYYGDYNAAIGGHILVAKLNR